MTGIETFSRRLSGDIYLLRCGGQRAFPRRQPIGNCSSSDRARQRIDGFMRIAAKIRNRG